MMTRARKQKMAAEDEQKQEMTGTAANACTSTTLSRLPQPLLILVLHFLPLPDKLTGLTRLNHSFPTLTSAAFKFDSLTLTPSLQAAWRSSPRLRQLLSAVCAVLYQQWDDRVDLEQLLWRDAEDSPGARVDRSRQQPSVSYTSAATSAPSLFSFPLVQQMALCVQQSGHFMSALFDARGTAGTAPSAAHYARLHTLRLVEGNCRIGPFGQKWHWRLQQPFFTPLRALPNLRTLNLAVEPDGLDSYGYIEWAAFRLLVSLPLTHLDLSTNEIEIPADVDVLADGVLDVTSTWKMLRLPRFCAAIASRAAVLHRLLQHYTEREADSAAGTLEYLRVEQPETAEEQACLRLSTLRSLEIGSKMRLVDFSPLYRVPPTTTSFLSSPPNSSSSPSSSSSASAAVCPLLRHLSIVNEARYIPHFATAEEVMGAVQQYVHLVSCYSATLVCLQL